MGVIKILKILAILYLHVLLATHRENIAVKGIEILQRNNLNHLGNNWNCIHTGTDPSISLIIEKSCCQQSNI